MIRKNRLAAFTLIEILFVIILMALITTIAIPKVTSTLGLSIRSSVLKVSGFLESAYQQAALSHKRIRINIDLDHGDYWADDIVETQEIPLIDEGTKLDDVLNEFRKRSESHDESDEDKKKKEAAQYKKIDLPTLQPSKLASGLKFKSVMFPGKEKTEDKGVASFFISSSGMNDKVVIFISHDDTTYSIIFPPMTGKSRVEKGEVDAKDL